MPDSLGLLFVDQHCAAYRRSSKYGGEGSPIRQSTSLECRFVHCGAWIHKLVYRVLREYKEEGTRSVVMTATRGRNAAPSHACLIENVGLRYADIR